MDDLACPGYCLITGRRWRGGGADQSVLVLGEARERQGRGRNEGRAVKGEAAWISVF